MRRAFPAVLLLAPTPALAHLPQPEAAGIGSVMARPFWFPDQALMMLALALLAALFPVAKLRRLAPAFVIAFCLGLWWGRPEAVPDTWLYMLAAAAAAVAALAPGRWLDLALILVLGGGVLNGSVSDPYPGAARPDAVALLITLAGALAGLTLLWGLPRLLLSVASRPWAGIAVRVLAAWACAIAMLMLALQFAPAS